MTAPAFGPTGTTGAGACLFAVLALAAATVPGCTLPEDAGAGPLPFSGPLPLRSLMPLSLIFPHPLPESAAVLPAGELEGGVRADYASIYVSDWKGGERILVDGEFSRTAFSLRAGLGGRTEIGVELPLLHYTSGMCDSFIEEWHDAFGLPQGKRDEAPSDEFGAVYAGEQGVFFSAEEDGLHLGDIPVTVKTTLLDPLRSVVGLALRGLVELPSGEDESGFGSGKLDGAAGFAGEKRFGRVAVYLSADRVFRKNPDSFHGVHVAHVTQASLAGEILVSRAVSLVLQTDFETRPMKGAELEELSGPQWSAAAGAIFRIAPDLSLRVAIAEGLTTESAPDITASAGLAARF